MGLTPKEIYGIECIVANSYNSNNYRLPSYKLSYKEANANEAVWADCIDDNGAKNGEPVEGKALAGVIGALNVKGYAISCGSGREATIMLTEAGWLAYAESMKELEV